MPKPLFLRNIHQNRINCHQCSPVKTLPHQLQDIMIPSNPGLLLMMQFIHHRGKCDKIGVPLKIWIRPRLLTGIFMILNYTFQILLYRLIYTALWMTKISLLGYMI
jgi:hypothetical protein